MRLNLPSQAYLAECFDYDPATGVLTWRARPREHFRTEGGYKSWTARFRGKAAGSVVDGRRIIALVDHNWHSQRVIWKLVTGEDPAALIDHRNGDGTDDRWENLRAATKQQNQHNGPMKSRNTTGFKGVSLTNHGERLPFRATVVINRKQIYLGTFATAEEAHAAYCEAAQRLHGEFWRAE